MHARFVQFNVTTEVSSEARASSTRSARPPRLFGGATRIDEDTPVSQLALSETRSKNPQRTTTNFGRWGDALTRSRRAYATWTGVSSD
ncbi:hypothetical protein HBI88_007250 [Parastagonospora nodorum]|nr:hypothetical protein HBI03_013680 [Parastagonospora nodorum]KAH4968017.1 hypothetical protein HBI78_063300 [Parastagonospora nodorum]KAH5043314.1 hypothetical protein HBI74_014800 [Parastagonospora nodorum]KAH5201835.1 hypothetical protein HBH77_120840 [Parastagonospora nodorum]KAH5515841.1 hypothetical protein HBI31_006520 [Parastagonospora nodorum]